MLRRRFLPMPTKPWPEEVTVWPWMWTSMSSQWAKPASISSALFSSLARRFSMVWSEKTTPQPNVSPGSLRSNTTMSCAESRSFMEMAKTKPAGPPPTQAMRMGWFIYEVSARANGNVTVTDRAKLSGMGKTGAWTLERQIIAAGSGVGLRLKRGACLRIIDPEGGQSGDLVAFSADGSERLSNGRTFDYAGKLYLSAGDVLWSDRSNPMLTIVSDEVGRHDFLYASCNMTMYRLQLGATGYTSTD